MLDFLTYLATRWSKMLEFGLLASYGAAASYIYGMLKHEDRKFNLWKFLGLLFLATFVGNFIGGFIPSDSAYRDELLMGFGFCTFPVLAVLEVKFVELFDRMFNKVG